MARNATRTTAASTLYHGTSQRPLQVRHSGFMAQQQRSSAAGPLDAGSMNGQPAAPAEVPAQGTSRRGLPQQSPARRKGSCRAAVVAMSAVPRESAWCGGRGRAQLCQGKEGEQWKGCVGGEVAWNRPPLSRESASSGAPAQPGLAASQRCRKR